jgi:membrane-bound lytic murein transglycosylase B
MKMKKIRLIFLSTAVILATVGAFATRTTKYHNKQSLYHRDPFTGTYSPVSPGYYCTTSYDSCTYYLDNGRYYANELGSYHGQ